MNTGIIIVIFLLIIYEWQTHYIYDYFTTDNVISSIDKRTYRVSGGFTDMNNASNTMAKLNNFIIEFLRFLRNKFIVDKQGLYIEQAFVKRLLKNYNPDVIFENNPKPGEDTSFVVNKGEQFAICLRNKKNKTIHDMNTLQFVIIHELTHMGCINYGHGYEFWSWMKFMLIQATKSGLYTPVDYSINPVSYCGMNVSFSPYYTDIYDWRSAKANDSQ